MRAGATKGRVDRRGRPSRQLQALSEQEVTEALLAVLVFATSLVIGYSGCRATVATVTRRTLITASWVTTQWAAAAISFVVAVKFSLWALIPEGLGMFVGAFLGARKTSLPPAVT